MSSCQSSSLPSRIEHCTTEPKMAEFTWSIYDNIPAPTSQSGDPILSWQLPDTPFLHTFYPQSESSHHAFLPPPLYPSSDSVRSRSSTPAWSSPTPAATTQGYTPGPSPSNPTTPIHQQTQFFQVASPEDVAQAYWGDFVCKVPNIRSPMLIRLCLALYDFAKNTSTYRVPKQPFTAAKPLLLPEMVIAIFDLSLDTDLLPFNQSEIQLLTSQKIDIGMWASLLPVLGTDMLIVCSLHGALQSNECSVRNGRQG
jgi:hypothetical protein